jgi:GT2 family glycosyltransferase
MINSCDVNLRGVEIHRREDPLEAVKQLLTYADYSPYEIKTYDFTGRRPKVSVCVPVYNGAQYIRDCINSILSQSFSDFELIFINDASTDNSKEIIYSFSDPRIKYFENERNLGLIGNWNKCLELSNGYYVCIFHQDDVMSPDNLEKKVALLELEKRVGLVFSDTLVIDPAKRIVSNHWFELLDPNVDFIKPGRSFFDLMFRNMNLICCPSVMARRECYENVGGFDARLPFTGDMEMWMRIALFYDVAYLSEPLILYRIHTSNETQNYLTLNIIHLYLCKWMLLEKYPEQFEPSYHEKLLQDIAQRVFERIVLLYQQQQYQTARQYLFFLEEIRKMSGKPGLIDEYIKRLSSYKNQASDIDRISQNKGELEQKRVGVLKYAPDRSWRPVRSLRKLTRLIRGDKNV